MTHTSLVWIAELLWLIMAAVVTALVLLPLYGIINTEYLTTNAIFVFLTITYFRLFIFVRKVPYLSAIWMRVLLILVLGVLFFHFMFVIQEFLWDMDGATISRFLTLEKASEYSTAIDNAYFYFRKEFILFATACQIMTLLLAMRLVHSMWQFGPKAMIR